MTRIAHLSDLHFGRDRPEIVEALAEAVNAAAPDVAVVSGDFTQRARNPQFRAARRFLGRLRAPWLAVPGNHDVPLDRPVSRLLRPYARYRRHIDAELEPRLRVGGVALCGVNSVSPLDWQRGRLGATRLARLRAALSEAEAADLRVVFAHHPVVHAEGERKALLRGATGALAALAEGRADLMLSGHLHSWRAEAAEFGGRSIVMAQAGTGLSTRLRGEENDFNLIRLSPERIEIERHAVAAGGDVFTQTGVAAFDRVPGGWRREGRADRAPRVRAMAEG